jgi:site-specific recombinase XerD
LGHSDLKTTEIYTKALASEMKKELQEKFKFKPGFCIQIRT